MIGLTQRIDTNLEYGEKRDALDRRWLSLCEQCCLLPIALPNCLSTVHSLLKKIPLDGFIFTGGNNLQAYGGDAPERDKVENALLDYALHWQLPILGVCRGMQFIQHFFHIPLKRIEGHVGHMHSIIFHNEKQSVNSYHEYGTKDTIAELTVLARAEDNIIEAIEHKKYPIKGIMWHPERGPFRTQDKKLLTKLFR